MKKWRPQSSQRDSISFFAWVHEGDWHSSCNYNFEFPSEKLKIRTKVALVIVWFQFLFFSIWSMFIQLNKKSEPSNVKARDTETLGNRKKKNQERQSLRLAQEGFSYFLLRIISTSELGFMHIFTSHREILFMYHQLALETHNIIIRYLLDFEITF